MASPDQPQPLSKGLPFGDVTSNPFPASEVKPNSIDIVYPSL